MFPYDGTLIKISNLKISRNSNMLYNSFGGPVNELFSSSEIDIINNTKEPDCCKTCRLQKKSIPYLSTVSLFLE